MIKDISELVRSEYAKSLEKVTEIMIASTSHDLRTPLSNIANMHHLIEIENKGNKKI